MIAKSQYFQCRKVNFVTVRFGAERRVKSEEYDWVDIQSRAFDESGEVNEHPSCEVRSAVRLILDVDQEMFIRASETAFHHNIRLQNASISHICNQLFVQKLETIRLDISGKFRQKQLDEFEEESFD